MFWAGVTLAQEFANVEYLCADWGPAMTLPAKTNAPPVYSETQEEIYFLKQVTFLRRETLTQPSLSGAQTQDVWTRRSIYLCKMKPDGGNKTEIKELWRNPSYPIDTQAQSTWMEVNEKTRRIALAISLAGTDLTGLWTLNLDGTELKRIMPAEQRPSYGSPSWTTDGKHIVYSEAWRGTNYCRIAKCDTAGSNIVYLTHGPVDGHLRVSPDGKRIAYIHWINWGSLLWLMDVDGKNQHALLDPKGKLHGGLYPAWSPDGKKILLSGVIVIDAETGKVITDTQPDLNGKPYTAGWCHWGKTGIVGHTVAGIFFTDHLLKKTSHLGISQTVECPKSASEKCAW
jgi:hypothetical protein